MDDKNLDELKKMLKPKKDRAWMLGCLMILIIGVVSSACIGGLIGVAIWVARKIAS